jgi:hypothetical protein
MVKELTLRRAGGSIGATLPKEMAYRLHLEAGDRGARLPRHSGALREGRPVQDRDRHVESPPRSLTLDLDRHHHLWA